MAHRVKQISGSEQIYRCRTNTSHFVPEISQASAHWVDRQTLLWSGGESKFVVRLYHNQSNKVEANDQGYFTDNYLTLTPTVLSQETAKKIPAFGKVAGFPLA
nr:hypothetical protein [Xenorhabdus cabanillasii]